jgi:hypothetical protein
MNDTRIIVTLVGVIVGLGLYAWYGFALSRLFPKLGVAAWKGWVPILNEAEILGSGGVARWNIVFSFIPVVQLYGIYFKAIAVHSIGEQFGKGAGHTVLGVFIPPVWATLLASARMPADGAYDRRVEGLLKQAAATGAGSATPPAVPAPYASAPPPPPPAPVTMSFPSLAASEPEPPMFITVPPAVAAPAAAPAPTAPARAPAPGADPAPGTIYNPWSREPPRTPAPVAAAPVVPPVADDEDEVDRTIAIERRPAVPWRLVTDEGHVIPLRARRILLGRKPVAPNNEVAAVAVPDATKTLSKNHARLELSDDGVWMVFDLDSTNGVIVIDDDGTETLLPPGGSAPVPGRFMLGTVAMRVTFDDTEVTR